MSARAKRLIPAVVAVLYLLPHDPVRGQGLLSVEPDHGAAGEEVPITVTSEPDAIFSEGSTLYFEPAGDKITHGQIVLEGSNILTTTIHIAADTPPGIQDVSVITGYTIFFGAELFEVTGDVTPDPVIVSVSPTSGYPGDEFSVTVTGSNTNFSGSSVLSFSPDGIQVTAAVNPVSSTVLEAQIAIAPDAGAGPRNVTVTTGAEVATGEGLFSVVEPPVTLTPSSGIQGELIATLDIVGGPGGYSAQTGVDLGQGIDIGAVTGSGSTLTLTDVSIALNSPVGRHDLTLTNPAFSATGVFLVEQGPDTQLLSITPSYGDRGHPGLPVSLLGQNTHFDESGLAISFSTLEVRAVNLNDVDQTHLEADLLISREATEGPIDVTVSLGVDTGCTDCERVSLAEGFEVTAPGTLDDADPWILEVDRQIPITISATDGQFQAGVTTLVFDPPDGLELVSVAVSDANHLTADVQVAEDASGDPRDVIAVTGPEVAFGPALLDVYFPEIRRIAPSTATPGTSTAATITGRDVPFDANTQVEFSGTGVSVNSVSFDPEQPDEIGLQLSVAADAPLGKRDVTVTAQGITVTGYEIFEVFTMKPKDDEGGCSCAAASAGSSLLGLCLGWLVLLRRRRRSTPPGS